MKNSIKVYGILLAAGSSERMSGVDKIWAELKGKPVISYSVDFFYQSELVSDFIIVTSTKNIDTVRNYLQEKGLSKIRIIIGGDRRQDSVKKAIDYINSLKEKPEYIAIHDVARPLVSESILEKGLKLASSIGAAIPVIPSKDTVKKVSNNLVQNTLNRDEIFFSQTPQIFSLGNLSAAYEMINQEITDDSMLIEISGGIVSTFPGDQKNIKITNISDLDYISYLLGEDKYEWSNGNGFDGHRFEKGGPLILGGIKIDFGYHLKGHSDGDVLLHSISNAILGGASLGDLGRYFPSTDSRYKDLDSSFFIKKSVELAKNNGWNINNIDATIIAEKPRLKEFALKMEDNIKFLIDSSLVNVNVKITSTDEVGESGNSEGILAHSTATLYRNMKIKYENL